MRPDTLSEAAERIVKGEPSWKAIGEFLDAFYGSASPEERLAKIRDEPPLTGDDKLDAVIRAAAEYLAKLYRLPEVPGWVAGPKISPRPPRVPACANTSPFRARASSAGGTSSQRSGLCDGRGQNGLSVPVQN